MFVYEILGLVRVDLMQQVRALLRGGPGPPQSLDVGVDQVEGHGVASASILVADREAGTGRDVGVAEGDASEVTALSRNLLLVALLDGLHWIVKCKLNDFWDLLVDPGFGGLDSVPHDEVSTQSLLEEEGWAHVLQLVEGLRHLQPVADCEVSGLQVDQREGKEAAS